MNVLLVIPYQKIEPYLLPNLGLGYLASALRKQSHHVDYLDCQKKNIGPKEWETFLRSHSYNVIGIQLYSYTHRTVLEMLQIAKRTIPDIVTVVGGPHPNAIPKETLEDNSEIDYAIHGEGENAFPELLSCLDSTVNKEKLSSVPNLAWRNKDNQVKVNHRGFIKDLDSIRPAWDLMDPRSYPRLSHGLINRGYPIAPIFSSRGCPYSCTFCSASANMGPKIRMRSTSNIVDEIKFLTEEFGVKEIHFEDDNFTFHKNFAKEVCQLIIDSNLRISWACPNGVRLDSLDTELLKLMERSGCYSFALGIESASDRVLKLMKKGDSNKIMREKIRLIAETTKIRMTGFIIVGFPGETEDDIKKTEKMVLEEPLHRVATGIFLPLPGTAICKDLIKQGKFPEKYDWNKLSPYDEDVYTDGSLTKKQIFSAKNKIQLKFYLRPRILWGILFEIHSLEQVKIALKMLLFWLGLARMKNKE